MISRFPPPKVVSRWNNFYSVSSVDFWFVQTCYINPYSQSVIMQRQIAHSLPTIDDHNLKIENQEKGKKEKKERRNHPSTGTPVWYFFWPQHSWCAYHIGQSFCPLYSVSDVMILTKIGVEIWYGLWCANLLSFRIHHMEMLCMIQIRPMPSSRRR